MKRYLFLTMMALVVLSCGKQTEEQQVIPERNVLITRVQDCLYPVRLPAQFRGKRDIAILPQVTATLEEVLVSEGQKVVKGQRMFVLNQTALSAAVDNAEATLAHAQAVVQTQQLETDAKKDLFEKDIVSEHEYLVQANQLMMAKAQMAEAQAALKRAQNDLSYTIICAPHTGVVGTINYRQGSLVGPQMQEPLTIVSDNSYIYAYTSMNESSYMNFVSMYGSTEEVIKSTPDFKMILNNGTVYERTGRLETMSGVIDPTTGAISLRVAFPNPDGQLVAGGSGQVETAFPYTGIVIPRTASFDVQDKSFVYIAQMQADSSYVTQAQAVELERLNETEFVVISGLEEGKMIIVDGVKKLTNGQPIKPIQ